MTDSLQILHHLRQQVCEKSVVPKQYITVNYE